MKPHSNDDPDTLHSGLLNKLPTEIRQYIYEQYYNATRERVIYFTHNGRHGKCVIRVNAETPPNACGSLGQPIFDLVKPQENLLCLPLTCRQIYSESMPILYNQAAFRFLSAEALIAFSYKVPAQYLGCITTLTLEAPGYSLLEDYFDRLQWHRVCQILSRLGRLAHLTVNMLDSERSLTRHNWAEVLDPMVAVTAPVDFEVKLHCEPDVLPVVGTAAPFRLSWLNEDGKWHRIFSESNSE